MNPRSPGPRSRPQFERHLPDLLLVLLVSAAPVLRLPSGGWLVAAAVIWSALALVLGLVAAMRRESAALDRSGRDLRLLVIVVAAVHAAAAVAGGVTAAVITAVSPALWLGICGAVIVVAAARAPGWWSAPALAALAAGLETASLLLARGPAAPAAVWGLLSSVVSLALLALAATALFAAERRKSAELQRSNDGHLRVRSEAEKLRRRGVDRRAPQVRNLTPEGRRVSTLSAVVGMDDDLDRILKLASLAVGARSVALFLLADDRLRLTLRRAVDGAGTALDRDAVPLVGDGVVGRVAQTRRPAHFSNLAPESLRPPLYRDATPVPALAAVPVSEAGEFRGVLLADAAVPDAFGREHERLLEGFAREVGTLLEGASAAAGRTRHGDKFETLAVISKDLSKTMKIEEILETLREHTCEIVPYDYCALFTADCAGRSLSLRMQVGFLDALPEECHIPIDHGLAGYVATQRQIVHLADLSGRGPEIEIVPAGRGQERIRCFLGLPLLNAAELVAVWVIASETPESYDDEHIELLSVVAAQAATLIANAVLHQTVELMAVTDGLTGLYNHRWFQEQLARELDRGDRHQEPLSLLLLDIDHFKKINDTYGHPFGDRVLKTLSAELKRLARRVDCVARYGGEEFAFILVNTDRRGCRASAERVLKAVRALRIPHEGGVFTFTLSIGTATCPGAAATREDLVRCSDQALYAAKAGGRNRAVAYHTIDTAQAPRAVSDGRREPVAT